MSECIFVRNIQLWTQLLAIICMDIIIAIGYLRFLVQHLKIIYIKDKKICLAVARINTTRKRIPASRLSTVYKI